MRDGRQDKPRIRPDNYRQPVDDGRAAGPDGEGLKMNIHEFGTGNEKAVLLIHPALVRWDYFEYVIPLLEDKYHVIVPALPGYDTASRADFTGVEEIASGLAEDLLSRGITELSCAYGCSLGGAVVMRLISEGKLRLKSAVMDGGITPYRLPWIVTRLIALRDFLMIYMGKLGGIRLLEKAFSTDEYSEEDLEYIADVLRDISAKTIWRTFESANNYDMPKVIRTACPHIEYWYAKAEEKDRRWDISYVRDNLPQTFFREFDGVGHGGLAVLRPEVMVSELERAMGV